MSVGSSLLHRGKALAVSAAMIGPSRESKPQTVTIERPLPEVAEAWRDPARLREIFDGIAEVDQTGSDRYRWTFAEPGEHTWDTVCRTSPLQVRFDPVDSGRNRLGLTIRFAESPRGTEVTMIATSPMPSAIASAGVFHALYRARALLQTGETPTLRGTASARSASESSTTPGTPSTTPATEPSTR